MKNDTLEDQYFVCKTESKGIYHFVIVSPGQYCNTGQEKMEKYKTKKKVKDKYGDHAFKDDDDQGEDTLSDDQANNKEKDKKT